MRLTAADIERERQRVSNDPYATDVERLLVHPTPFGERDTDPQRHLARLREMHGVLSHADFLQSLQSASPVLLVWLANTRRICHLLSQICESPRSPLLIGQHPNPEVQDRVRQSCMEVLLRLSTYPNHFSDKLWKTKSEHSGRLLPTFDSLLSLYLAHYAQTVDAHPHNATAMASAVAQRQRQLLFKESIPLVRLERRFDELNKEGEVAFGDSALTLVCPPAVPPAVVWGDRVMLAWAKEQWQRWLQLFAHEPQLWESVVSLSYNPSVRDFLVHFIDECGRQKRERTATDKQLHTAEVPHSNYPRNQPHLHCPLCPAQMADGVIPPAAFVRSCCPSRCARATLLWSGFTSCPTARVDRPLPASSAETEYAALPLYHPARHRLRSAAIDDALSLTTPADCCIRRTRRATSACCYKQWSATASAAAALAFRLSVRPPFSDFSPVATCPLTVESDRAGALWPLADGGLQSRGSRHQQGIRGKSSSCTHASSSSAHRARLTRHPVSPQSHPSLTPIHLCVVVVAVPFAVQSAVTALSSTKAVGVERRLDDEATVGCLLHLLQLWPLLVDCHHRFSRADEKQAEKRSGVKELIHQLDLHLAVHSSVLSEALQLLKATLREESQLPPALTVRVQVFLLRYLELLVSRRPSDAHQALLTLGGLPLLLSLYSAHSQRGGPVKTSLYFLLLAILTSGDQQLQSALLVQRGLCSLLLDDFLTAAGADESRIPAQTCRLLALTVILPVPAVRQLVAEDARLPALLTQRPVVCERLLESLRFKDYEIRYRAEDGQEEPAVLLDRWLQRAHSKA